MTVAHSCEHPANCHTYRSGHGNDGPCLVPGCPCPGAIAPTPIEGDED